MWNGYSMPTVFVNKDVTVTLLQWYNTNKKIYNVPCKTLNWLYSHNCSLKSTCRSRQNHGVLLVHDVSPEQESSGAVWLTAAQLLQRHLVCFLLGLFTWKLRQVNGIEIDQKPHKVHVGEERDGNGKQVWQSGWRDQCCAQETQHSHAENRQNVLQNRGGRECALQLQHHKTQRFNSSRLHSQHYYLAWFEYSPLPTP